MVKNMQKQPHIQEVKALDAFCEQCGNNHDASECGQQIESSCYVGNYNKNAMSNTYNPAWRNHPNFSWKNQNNTLNPQQPSQTVFQNQPRQNQQLLPRQEYQQPSDYKNLENTLTQFMAQTSAYMARTDRFIQKTDAFMDRTEMKLQNHDATLKSLETQVGQISQILSSRPIGGFPSDTEVAKGATHEQCKAITTRSGKILTSNQRGMAANPSPTTDAPTKAEEPAQAREDHSSPHTTTGESSAESTHAKSDKPEEIRPPPPFPQRLKKQKQDYQFKKFLDILKQVHINLPLVEALQQMPNYAKFLKDMVTRKKRIEEFETVAATETCLALMHNKVPTKKTDPGSFTIECFIGHNYPTKALCDPEASINLMPKSVFQKLGIGEAKPTTAAQEDKLIETLQQHKEALGWTIADIKGISPTICMHKILLEDNHKPTVDAQRRLNQAMKDVVRKEILKWLDASIIYPISDSEWVRPIQCVPKKGGITVISNEKNELIPTRTITGWRVCYNQIAIAPEDQSKTTFTCPYGTFAFRRMPFGLCNAPATFQRCMTAIFSDLNEDYLEIFMEKVA
ncbi:hypothetical protein V6N11_084270 [Hibiscus sabdariffa]|uniref:Reverse transcriptase domain-containing protein n=1 Tax=Hibiscus sabdariffa TaxID=183260 RepID=A0ABR2QSJ4_9ROSI